MARLSRLSSVEGSLRDSIRISVLGRLSVNLAIRALGFRPSRRRRRELFARIDRVERLIARLKRPSRRSPRPGVDGFHG